MQWLTFCNGLLGAMPDPPHILYSQRKLNCNGLKKEKAIAIKDKTVYCITVQGDLGKWEASAMVVQRALILV